MKSAILVLAFAAALQPPPEVRTLVKGQNSRLDGARQVVVRTAAEFTALWTQMGDPRPAPEIDFTREMVVGVFMGHSTYQTLAATFDGFTVEKPKDKKE